jgi:hypothetical protein
VAESTDLIILANVTASGGAASKPRPLRAEPPGESGGEQAGRWMFRRRMEMQALRERQAEDLMSEANPAAMTEGEIETELAQVELKLSEALGSGSRIGELEARQFRLRAELKFRNGKSR